MLIKMIWLGFWMIFVPLCMGFFACDLMRGKNRKAAVKKETLGFIFSAGYMLMWAVFQVTAVPFVIKQMWFPYFEYTFECISLTVVFSGIFFFWLHFLRPQISVWKSKTEEERKRQIKNRVCMPKLTKENVTAAGLWLLFLAGLLFQMLQAYRLAFADGDDAHYIPISTSANLGMGMYLDIPYTGVVTGFDARHGLAPFPIWVSFIAAKCRVNTAVAAHSLMPPVLIFLTYVIYLETGRLLCREKKAFLPAFMVFVSLLQIFGNYSIYPASTFLLTRSRQGKAALGNVILPFFILLLLRIAEEVKERGKAGRINVFWLTVTMAAGCLCSTISGFLCCMLVMLTAGLLFLLYRKPGILWQGFVSCLPGIFYALLYFRLK